MYVLKYVRIEYTNRFSDEFSFLQRSLRIGINFDILSTMILGQLSFRRTLTDLDSGYTQNILQFLLNIFKLIFF